MSETRMVLPLLSKIGPLHQCGDSGETTNVTAVAKLRSINAKRVATGLASGPTLTLRKTAESAARTCGSSAVLSGVDFPNAVTPSYAELALTGIQDKTVGLCLPAIEAPDETRQQRVITEPVLPTPSDAAYIRSRSVTPSLLGAPRTRDLLPRSKKTTLFTGYLPDLPQQDDDGSLGNTNMSLTIEGHHDLKLPPRRTPTESRRVEKSRHKLELTPTLNDADEFSSWEENLKKLLLCQSMGIRLEISNKHHDFAPGKSVCPIFHCLRCMTHWSEHGTTPDDCQEPEVPTAGPTFNITNRSHEIMRDFERLSLEDKRHVVDVMMSRESARIMIGDRDGFDSMHVTLTGGRTYVRDNVKDLKTTVDIKSSETRRPYVRTTIDEREDSTISQKVGKVMAVTQHDIRDEKTPITGFNTKDGTETDPSRHRIRRHGEYVDDYDQEHLGLAHGDWRKEGHGPGFAPNVKRQTGVDEDLVFGRFDGRMPQHKPVGKFEFGTPQSQSEKSGQYGPDGAYYPGNYGPDGRFIATCRIASDGQRQPVVMGPDGKFYTNATYGPDGRFNLGEKKADKYGVVFLSAAEMAVLKTTKQTKQGVVGPDGLFYPKGLYQSDGSFVPGGPPHSGHPVVWGPTVGSGPGLYNPPSNFGPAWPPGTPAPYSPNQNSFGPGGRTEEFIYSDEDGMSEGVSPCGYSSTVHTHQSAVLDPQLDDVITEVADETKQDLFQELEEDDDDAHHPRDLFSPWGMDHDRRDFVAEKSETISQSAELDGKQSLEDYPMNVEIVLTDLADDTEDENRKEDYLAPELQENETYVLDDLEKDVPLENLDSRIFYVESDEERRDGILHHGKLEGDKLPTGSGSRSQIEHQQAEAADGVGESKVTDTAEDDLVVSTQETESANEISSRKRGDMSAYMGIVEQTDSNYRRDSSHSKSSTKARRGSVYADSRTESGGGGGKALSSKQGKNPAVRNVTGKPETKAGMLQKHMLATPHADLTQTNSMGIKTRRTSIDVRGSQNTIKGSESTVFQSQGDDSFMAKPKLPSIGGGEPSKDAASGRKSKSPIKHVQQSVSRIGSGEKHQHPDTESLIVPPDDTVKPRSGKRGSKIVKKTGKETRKSRTRRQDPAKIESKDEQTIGTNDAVGRESTANETQPILEGTFNDIIKVAETMSRDKIISSPTKSASLLDKFSEFRISAPSSSPLPTEHAPSFRMQYSTLPNYGAKAPQSTVPVVDNDNEVNAEVKTSRSKAIPFDFEKGYEIRARKSSSTRTLKSKKSGKKVGSKSRIKRSGSMSSESTRCSSAESVWESVSEIWKRQKDEMAIFEKHVGESYLPLTHAFTFSMFPLAPGHAAHNRLLLERASAIKQLRKPLKFNKPRAAAKPRKPVPVKTTAPVK